MYTDFSDVCFVPDTNIIYPCVFLHNATSLPQNEGICKKCFEKLKEDFNVKVLPENESEFLYFVHGKFHDFLDVIRDVATKARDRNQDKVAFEKYVWNQITALGRDYGDLVLYWKVNKNFFFDWVSMDNYSAKISSFRLIESTLERYRACVIGLTVSWNKTNEENCEKIFDVLKQERKRGSFQSDVDDNDLRLIAGCFEYVDKYLPSDIGLLYLITNDELAHDTVKKAVRLTSITGGTGKIRPGLDSIKPQDFLRKLDISRSPAS